MLRKPMKMTDKPDDGSSTAEQRSSPRHAAFSSASAAASRERMPRLRRILAFLSSSPVVLLTAILCTVLVGGVGLSVIERMSKESVVDRLKMGLRTSETTLLLWLEHHQKIGAAWAGQPEIARSVEAVVAAAAAAPAHDALVQSAELRRLRERLKPVCENHGYVGFVVIDAAGRQIGALLDDAVGSQLTGTTWDAVRRSFAGETLITAPFVSSVALPDVDGKIHTGGTTMFSCAPVRGPSGDVIAVLAFRLRPESEFAHALAASRCGATGETYVFDRRGLMLSHSRFDEQLRRLRLIPPDERSHAMLSLVLRDPGEGAAAAATGSAPDAFPLTKPVAEATAGWGGVDVDGYRDYRGEYVVGAWRWLPKFDWGIVHEMDYAEAFATQRVVRTMFLILLGLFVVGLVVNFLFHVRRRAAERAQADAVAALRENEERFSLAIRGSNDGIWDWDVTTGEAFYSARFKQHLGYADHEFPNRFDAFTEHLHPDDRESALADMHEHLATGLPCDLVCRVRTKDGAYRWFRLRGEAVRDADGDAWRMVGSISDVSALKEAEAELLQAARLDKLTGLPNRRLLLDRLQLALHKAKRSPDRHMALMFLDFDRFKIINDSLGHKAGDALLKQIAQRLRDHVRSTDSVSRRASGNTTARLGGDEFVVLLDELRNLDDAVIVAERMLKVFAEPYQLEGHEVFSTASIGIVLGHGDYENAEDMLRDADVAMYEAKRAGKARYVVFDASMRERTQRRLKLERDLRKAVEAGQMALAYQPIVSLESGEMKGVEALLRWRHPVEGSVSPAEFIPIAEDTGLIIALGEWVLREGCRQMAQWQQTFGPAAPSTMCINLSRKQFVLPTLSNVIRQVIEETGVAPHAVQLEVTETACMDDVVGACRAMKGIKDLGVKLAIDDFGTGYSSLSSLHQFPVDVLKIDRSFVAQIDDTREVAALVHALVDLARNLGVSTVAEGVEKSSQVVTLYDLGCDYAQGYFFGKPMPPDELEQLITHGLHPNEQTA